MSKICYYYENMHNLQGMLNTKLFSNIIKFKELKSNACDVYLSSHPPKLDGTVHEN